MENIENQIQQHTDPYCVKRMKPKITDWIIAGSSLLAAIATIITIVSVFNFIYGKDDIKILDADTELEVGQDWGDLYFYQTIMIGNVGVKQGSITSVDGLIVSKSTDNKGNPYFEKYVSGKAKWSYSASTLPLMPGDRGVFLFDLHNKEDYEQYKDTVLLYLRKCEKEFEKEKLDSIFFNEIKNLWYNRLGRC